MVIVTLYVFINEYLYMLDNPDIVGSGSLEYLQAGRGTTTIIIGCIQHLFFWPIIFGDFITMIISITRLPNRIKKYVGELKPLDPDRCGGLKPIGDLCMVITIIYFLCITLYSLLQSQRLMAEDVNLVIRMAIVYFVMWLLGILVFMIPQYSVHIHMVEVKRKYLQQTMQEFEKAMETEANSIEEELLLQLKLSNNINFFNEIEKMREYPFDDATLKKLIGVAVIPIGTKMISLILAIYGIDLGF